MSATAVLVAACDATTRDFLVSQLEADGYDVISPGPGLGLGLGPGPSPSPAPSPGQGRGAPVDVLVATADAHGLALARRVRAGELVADGLESDVLIVLLGAADELDLVRAFEAGADDVLSAPPRYRELRARLQALLRRRERLPGTVLVVGDLRLDTLAHRASVGRRAVELCRREYDLLAHLAREPQRVFSKAELLRDVWGFRSLPHTRTLDNHACRLRRKLADAGVDLVVNVWGVGYCLTRPLAPGA